MNLIYSVGGTAIILDTGIIQLFDYPVFSLTVVDGINFGEATV